ncbi:MAG: MFS transporter [Clostridia bacterium]
MFSKVQQRILFGCFLAYTAAYIGRLNLAQALPGIAQTLGLTGVQLGTLQTVFALTYASGQFIVGMAADRVSPRKLILTGLAATALFNALFGLASSYPALLALWTLNGIAQSLMWTPIVRLIAGWCVGKTREQAGFVMSAATIIGHLLSWAIAGWMATVFSWRLSFIVPGLIILAVWPISHLLIRDYPLSEAGKNDMNGERQVAMPFKTLIAGTGLWAILICCVATGFVRDSVTTWGPSMLARTFDHAWGGSASLSLIIPLINIFGLFLGRRCFLWMHSRTRMAVMTLLFCGVLSALLLYGFGTSNPLLLAVLLGLTCAILYANTPLLTALIPMEYASANRVALVAGLVDCTIYLGSGLAGILTGYMNDLAGWNMVFLGWVIACLLGVAFAGASMHEGKALTLRQ